MFSVYRGEYGHYQLGERKGSGAYGTVYLATEQQTGRPVPHVREIESLQHQRAATVLKHCKLLLSRRLLQILLLNITSLLYVQLLYEYY